MHLIGVILIVISVILFFVSGYFWFSAYSITKSTKAFKEFYDACVEKGLEQDEDTLLNLALKMRSNAATTCMFCIAAALIGVLLQFI